jgi:hypothetical protein
MLVMVEPAIPQDSKADRLKSERAGCTGLQLAVDLRGQRAGCLPVAADPRLAALILFEIGEISDLATKENPHPADTKRRRFLDHERGSVREG